jgi:hypothetical protein
MSGRVWLRAEKAGEQTDETGATLRADAALAAQAPAHLGLSIRFLEDVPPDGKLPKAM